ncbi:hypothetical protein BDW42DRAFT_166915 [Aspergillus taichungensis]|uniref:Uncharacterized protein n=1 Tax=Aspergillus taichungensis TaxID=482145 RepID=A0A2J5HY05_9EURO|nr:hypothetical protein BDW42DRAFT_166915 [Aspergillus taichungensis]
MSVELRLGMGRKKQFEKIRLKEEKEKKMESKDRSFQQIHGYRGSCLFVIAYAVRTLPPISVFSCLTAYSVMFLFLFLIFFKEYYDSFRLKHSHLLSILARKYTE